MIELSALRTLAGKSDPAYTVRQQCFDRALAAEAVVMLAVLSLAALLGHTSPTAG